jgi:Zn-dependent alcohol dehydrogenase
LADQGQPVRLGESAARHRQDARPVQAGTLKLDELVTSRYSLDEVNQGYADLVAGKNIRGVLIHG